MSDLRVVALAEAAHGLGLVAPHSMFARARFERLFVSHDQRSPASSAARRISTETLGSVSRSYIESRHAPLSGSVSRVSGGSERRGLLGAACWVADWLVIRKAPVACRVIPDLASRVPLPPTGQTRAKS